MNEKSNVKIKDPFLYKITIQFANLPLEEALKKFKTNYALVTDSKSKKGNIKRIVVVLEGQQANLSLKEVRRDAPIVNKGVAEEKRSRPEPFKFEFDPSTFMKK